MKRAAMVLVGLQMLLAGCTGIEWFPETESFTNTSTATFTGNSTAFRVISTSIAGQAIQVPQQ